MRGAFRRARIPLRPATAPITTAQGVTGLSRDDGHVGGARPSHPSGQVRADKGAPPSHPESRQEQRKRQSCSHAPAMPEIAAPVLNESAAIRSPHRRGLGRVEGIVRPRALAVLRLTAVSNLVGVCTGRSPGAAPRRMRST